MDQVGLSRPDKLATLILVYTVVSVEQQTLQ